MERSQETGNVKVEVAAFLALGNAIYRNCAFSFVAPYGELIPSQGERKKERWSYFKSGSFYTIVMLYFSVVQKYDLYLL